MESKAKIEEFYRTEDPWGYKVTDDDDKRKTFILNILKATGLEFENALDIGAGEGWITKDLPAKYLYGYELSDTASSRFPSNVRRINFEQIDKFPFQFDLIVATGVLYPHYDIERFKKIIKKHFCKVLLTCNMAHAEETVVSEEYQYYMANFQYRDTYQNLRLYRKDVSTS